MHPWWRSMVVSALSIGLLHPTSLAAQDWRRMVDAHFDSLASPDPVGRATAAMRLCDLADPKSDSDLQHYLARTIPRLIALLPDGTPLEMEPFTGSNRTTPGELARCALVGIGRESVAPLIHALNALNPVFTDTTLFLGLPDSLLTTGDSDLTALQNSGDTAWLPEEPDSILYPWRAPALTALQAITGQHLPADSQVWANWWSAHSNGDLPGERSGFGTVVLIALPFTAVVVAIQELLQRRQRRRASEHDSHGT